MENVNDASTYENCVADVIIHNLPDFKSPKSNIGQVKNEEVTHIYTNQVMEIEDEMNESITVEVEAEVKSNIGQLKKEEVTHFYSNQVMEIEDKMNESITVEIEAEETSKKHLVVSNSREFQDVINRPEDLPVYSRLIIRQEDLFKTFEDNQTATDETLKSKWTAFLEKALRSENVTSRSLWIWRTIFIILVVTLALLLYFTRRTVQNHYHIYH